LAIIALAAAEPADDERVDGAADRFTGRYANLWGVTDIVRLGGRLLALSPEVDDPTPTVMVLARTGQDRLNVRNASGLGGVGEDLVFSFGPDGAVTNVRGPSGMTSWPIASLSAVMTDATRIGPGALADLTPSR
jgi:hypothetical protein